MYYELALISVLVAGGYWGWYFVRHQPTRLYGLLQLAAAGLCGLGLLGRRIDEGSLGVPGAIGAGAGLCFLVLGPVARGIARRFAGAERFKAAEIMLDIAEVLAPGSGVSEEKALLGAMREIRDGNIEQTVEALTAAKDHAPADARLAIDERIAMLYLAAYRWDDAIAHAEEHLFGAIGTAGDAGPGNIALRRALGIAPAVWVELLGAYGYKGELDQAARMLARLEEVCAGRPDATMWIHRGRLIFLALAGRTDAVRTLVEPRRSRHMRPSARTYWIAVSHERQGEVAAAEAAYAKARSRSRGRPRMLIDQALARLQTAKATELGPIASEVVARVEAAPPPAVVERVRPRGPIATRILAASLVLTAIAVAVFVGPSSDYGVLVRDGALVRDLVHAGEWWRLVSCIFVHVGGLHLLVNLIGLWLLGRLAEELFGPWRMAAIFALAGIGGSVASLLATTAGISAGASGAVFGLLGAVFIELTWQRKRHRTAWTRGVWGSLAVVAVAQLGVDFLYGVTDHWAHAGGLAIGTLAGMALSPNAAWQRLAHHVARVVTVAFAAAVVVTAVLVARTTIDDSLAASPDAIEHLTQITKMPIAGGNIDAYLSGTAQRASRDGFDQTSPAPDTLIPMPNGWSSSELVGTVPDELGDHQKYRIVIALGPDHVVTLYIPETIARAAPDYFTRRIPEL